MCAGLLVSGHFLDAFLAVPLLILVPCCLILSSQAFLCAGIHCDDSADSTHQCSPN